jgi:hypothetical protein
VLDLLSNDEAIDCVSTDDPLDDPSLSNLQRASVSISTAAAQLMINKTIQIHLTRWLLFSSPKTHTSVDFLILT